MVGDCFLGYSSCFPTHTQLNGSQKHEIKISTNRFYMPGCNLQQQVHSVLNVNGPHLNLFFC